jgi:hypothetical protein
MFHCIDFGISISDAGLNNVSHVDGHTSGNTFFLELQTGDLKLVPLPTKMTYATHVLKNVVC